MKWQSLINDGFSRVLEVIEPALAGLNRNDLNRQPKPDCNSIGWIVWHLSRGLDAQIADLTGEEQLWIKDGWYSKFNRTKDPGDTGFGDTPEDVAAFKSPAVSVLLDYYRDCLVPTNRFIAGLSLTDLDRVIDESYKPPVTIGVRLISILADCLEHSGEVAYLRGLLKGMGWLGY